MADVTINDLSPITPAAGLFLPVSNGTTTGNVTLSQVCGVMSSAQITTALGYTPYNGATNPNNYATTSVVPKFAYAIMSQSGSAPYAVTLIASKNVASVTGDSVNANVTINWSNNYFNDENYCVTFGIRSDYCGNRSAGLNLVCSSQGSKTRNSVVVMVGSSSSGGFAGMTYFNVMAVQ
jgi:hypothetical protein